MFHTPTCLMHCDLNWTVEGAAAPQDWAFVDPQEYFDWHMDFGTNVMYCQAYLFGGTALYPSKLGPLAPGPGSQLFPSLYELARDRGVPVWSYMCVGADLVMSNHRTHWVVPGSRDECPHGFLAPESGWTDLLCARIEEFLTLYPVDWMLYDWFVYGGLKPNETLVQPAAYAAAAFRRVIGRDLPDTAADITGEEHLKYKRTILAEQFHRIQESTKRTSPTTKIIFNVPYWEAAEALWVDHPMLNESDGLFAECSSRAVVDWLLDIKRPEQRVMTTVVGRTNDECDPNSWREWYDKGCDFFGYAWGTPPDFRPHPRYAGDLDVIHAAFAEMKTRKV